MPSLSQILRRGSRRVKPSDTPEAENKKVGQDRNHSGNGTAAPPANRAVAFAQDSVPRASGTTGSVRPPMSDDNGLEQDLSEAWATANRPLQMSKTDRMLQKAEDHINNFQESREGTLIQNAIDGAKMVFDSTGGTEAIESNIKSFLEGSQVLLDALDEVGKLHPFIGVAVFAFKAVWKLEMKRRDNDKKIMSLHAEMRDMMTVLLQLKNVKDADEIAPDGTTIKGRMQGIIQKITRDIKACSNTCDAYSKKKLIAKVLKGPIWEPKLLAFVQTFTKRRGELEFSLTIHTAVGVDSANIKLDEVAERQQAMDAQLQAKMDLMLKMFAGFASPEEKELETFVKKNGGADTVLNDDKLLKEVNEHKSNRATAADGSTPTLGHNPALGKKVSELEDLKEELIDPEIAIAKNLEVFSRKYEEQARQITEELTKVITRDGDRVIASITAGPHDRIVDPDLFAVWKENGWRGSVKARNLVLALRDYWTEKGLNARHAKPTDPSTWALEYLSVARVLPISGALDDDASGFVSIAEVNAFTKSRPLEWSLLHWIAYWAIGWHQSIIIYADKIDDLVAKMYAIVESGTILPENRDLLHSYLEYVDNNITPIQASVKRRTINETLQDRFQPHVDAEEQRLRKSLEGVRYDIDALDTLELVTGPGRIGKCIMPLLYLLLKQHFEVFRLCRAYIVHENEIPDMTDTLQWVLDEFQIRLKDLKATFYQQRVDLDQQFKAFAHGLYEYTYDPQLFWDVRNFKNREWKDFSPYDDSGEIPNVKASDILNYPANDGLDSEAYATADTANTIVMPPASSDPLAGILGTWNGYHYRSANSKYAANGMISMNFVAVASDGPGQRFQAVGMSNGCRFTIYGECILGKSDTLEVRFKKYFQDERTPRLHIGTFDRVTQTLSGKSKHFMDEIAETKAEDSPEGNDENTWDTVFVYSRIPGELIRFRPAPIFFVSNRAAALWKYALSSVLQQVRRQLWSSDFFKRRRADRKRFVALYPKDLEGKEAIEYDRLRQRLSNADSRFYHSLAEMATRNTVDHGLNCDYCRSHLVGARIICLNCQFKEKFAIFRLCNLPKRCMEHRVVREDLERPHLPTHDLVKIRRRIHARQFSGMSTEAMEALATAKSLLSSDPISIDEDSAESEDEGSSHEATSDTVGEVGTANTSKFVCAGCGKDIIQPVWFCVHCSDPTWICFECDANGPPKLPDRAHGEDHDLVRVQQQTLDIDLTTDHRLISLEERMSHLESQSNDVNEMLHAIIGRLGLKVAGMA